MDDGDWTLVESVTEYETGWYTGGYDLYVQPDGTEKKYYWAELPPAVVVVARDGDELVFVEQFRPTIRRRCLELVAGIVEETGERHGSRGEDNDTRPTPDRERYVDAAARELEEETGYEAESVEFLADFWVCTGAMRHRRGIVYADELTETGSRALDTNEFIEVTRYPVDEAFERAVAAPSNDATLEGLLLAERDGLI